MKFSSILILPNTNANKKALCLYLTHIFHIINGLQINTLCKINYFYIWVDIWQNKPDIQQDTDKSRISCAMWIRIRLMRIRILIRPLEVKMDPDSQHWYGSGRTKWYGSDRIRIPIIAVRAIRIQEKTYLSEWRGRWRVTPSSLSSPTESSGPITLCPVLS